MGSDSFYLFVVGFSLLMAIQTFVRSYLNSWDKSYLYCALLFTSVILNCFFWVSDIDLSDFGCPSSITGTSIGLWFNHMNPILLLLLYREFLDVKRDSPMVYSTLSYGIGVLIIRVVTEIIFTFVPDDLGVGGIFEHVFLVTLLALFTILPIYTYKYFKHPYYKFAAFSSWVIWGLYGMFFLIFHIPSITEVSSHFFNSGQVLFVILLVDGVLFLVALTVKDKLVSINNIQLEKDAMSYKLKSLQNQMNPHFIFNCLNSIKSLNMDGYVDQANHYLDEFGTLLRQVLIQSDSNRIKLQCEIDNIIRYLELEQLRLNDKFQFTINIDNDVDTELMEIPPLLIQPYIENAIWHGISHANINDGLINIWISVIDETLRVSIKDNGVGVNESIRSKTKLKQNDSRGMEINQERIKSISRLYGASATVDVKDLKESGQSKSGTEVVLQIPFLI